MRKRKKKKLRNNFTDALGEEISSRKSLNLEERKKNLPKVDLTKKNKPKSTPKKSAPAIAEYKVEEVQSAEVEEVKVEAVETPKVKVAEVVETKVEEIEPPKVEVDKDFEKRVLAEADNNFHDEKPKRYNRKFTAEGRVAPPRPTFRTKTMREKLDDERSVEINTDDKDTDLHRKLTRAETAGVVLSALMLVYSISTYDKPLFFMAMSLLSHTLRPIIGAFFGKHNRAVQNALRGFSIVLFFGALLFLFV